MTIRDEQHEHARQLPDLLRATTTGRASGRLTVHRRYRPTNRVTLHAGDCMDMLRSMPDACADLVVTSPPYNIGKEYEKSRGLDEYAAQQRDVIRECHRVLAPSGSICWQVGNYVDDGEIVPLDMLLHPMFRDLGMKMRNRIVWHFEHGLHCSRRFSGRYEVIAWYTKSKDYVFNLDPVRVPQKYPGKKHFKGPRAGELSGNPLGKNPSDVWVIPNVKHNHVEKTEHPCQFPVELVERLILSLTNPDALVIDPFLGTGTTAIAAILHKRRAAGAEIIQRYIDLAEERLELAATGRLRTRPMNTPVYMPPNGVSKSIDAAMPNSISLLCL